MEPNAARRFCLIAAATVFTLFSLASAKLVPYILPAFPFLAVVVADGLMTFAEVDESRATNTILGLSRGNTRGADPQRLLFMATAIALAGAAVLAVAYDPARFKSPYLSILRPVLYVSGATVVICALICSVAFWKRRLEVGLALLVGGAAVTLMIISYGRIKIEPTRSYATLARNIERLAPAARLICYPRFIESLPFYCRRRVILVGAKTELTYGAEHGPDASGFFFTRRDDLVRLWDEPQDSVLVIDRGVAQQIQRLLGKYTVIASDSRKLALTRSAKNSGAADRLEKQDRTK
jgi:4-amino-4-deoxy-L-arabinose transferase-like glycosyltransferase